MRARMLTALVVATVGIGGTALPGVAAPAPTAPPARGAAMPAFYTPPATLPATNGALVRSEPLKLALNLPGINKRMPGDATRIMYRTTDSTGKAAAVTGAYLEPDVTWSGPGARPLVVLAPGTIGQGDQCSASLGLERPIAFGNGPTVAIGYEILAMYRLLQKGVAVAVTDYVGLGTPDRVHTYVNRVDEGHAVLDAARAVRQLRGSSLTPASRVATYGYSQGGGATASAAELQATYAPDVPLVATSAGAPPADLAEVTKGIEGSELFAAIAWAINGFVDADPSLQPILDRYTSASGKAALKDASTMCTGDSVKYAFGTSASWTTGGRTVSEIAAAEPALQKVFTSQLIGTIRPAGPVRVSTGVNDNLVPHGQARTMAVSWCKLGADVSYVPVQVPNTPSKALNHAAPLLADQTAAIDWLTARLSGRPATSNCATIGSQP